MYTYAYMYTWILTKAHSTHARSTWGRYPRTVVTVVGRTCGWGCVCMHRNLLSTYTRIRKSISEINIHVHTITISSSPTTCTSRTITAPTLTISSSSLPLLPRHPRLYWQHSIHTNRTLSSSAKSWSTCRYVHMRTWISIYARLHALYFENNDNKVHTHRQTHKDNTRYNCMWKASARTHI